MSDEDATREEFVRALFGGGPNPYDGLRRVLSWHRRAQRAALRLEVWCEANRCTPIRVYALREGLLVQCRSDADARDRQDRYPHLDDWSRRRAFYLEEWLAQPADVLPNSHLQVVCDCDQTHPRLVDVQRLADLVPAAATRRCTLHDVSVTSG